MYAYCNNNPINLCDPNGTDAAAAKLYLQNNPTPPIYQGPGVSNTALDKWIAGYNAALAAPGSTSASKNTKTSITNSNVALSNRKPGKTPPSKWPKLPTNLGGKKPTWNPGGYWEGKYGETTWDSKSHGTGVDRGNGPQDGHWDTGSGGRYNREGGQIIAGAATAGVVLYGIYTVAKWIVAVGGAPETGGASLLLFATP